ncbi:MAG: ATP-binding cassette domain-containing protein [Methyloprofundus sp.]|nr:ATP-binding cassette domain-containing protein [Methyloprofundus sp.]
MNTEIAISLKKVSKYYKLYDDPKYRLKEALHPFGKIYHQNFYATKNINLEIKKGEILGIVGKNGSGKSTLLKLITNVLTPDKGSIKVSGKISALLELGSGFNPAFTGLQNISFYGMILGFSKKEMGKKLNDIIAFADIGDFINQPLKTYSSGMKARLAFAVAAHIDPEILILDEVLAVGDIHFRRKSYAKIQELFESGKTIIYVSHSLGEVNRLCNRAIMLHAGEILMDGEPKVVTKYYEKYLFAKDESKQNILDEIKDHIPEPDDTKQTSGQPKSNMSSDIPQNTTKNTSNAFLIPGFESQNPVEYDDTFLKIEDIHIETMCGNKVNALVTNERYVYCYTLTFLDNFYSVDFGMQIHNEKGVLITGSKQEESHDFKAGDIVEIKWEFDCLMHEGIYYTSTGVNHLVNGKREYINRIVDAMIFKVLPVENCCNGLVYLKQSAPDLIYLNNKASI